MTLYDKYGYCVLPAHSFLYRAGEISEDVIFFGLNPYLETYSNGTDIIEMWETKKEIKLLFMISELANLRTKTAILEIYNGFFPSDQVSYDLHIKYHENKDRRSKFVNTLKQLGISGWLTSEEGNKNELEICLFRNYELFSYINFVTKGSSNEFEKMSKENALKAMNVFPSASFKEKTIKNLARAQSYNEYVKYMAAGMKYDCENSLMTEMQWENLHYDLRLKLKM